ncbi:MAG: tetratricopeptide repeat protein [Candidatus Paceibacterota bacterium]
MDNYESVETISNKKFFKSLIDKVSFWGIILLTFLIPIFFTSVSVASLPMAKGILIFGSVTVLLLLFIISRLKEGSISFPRHALLLAIPAIPLVYFLSSIFSPNRKLSILGLGFDTDSAIFMLLMAVLVYLVTVIVRSKERIFYVYISFLLSFLVIALYQGVRLFVGPDFLSFGVFTTQVTNMIGKWNDLGIFFGLISVLTLMTLEQLSVKKLFRVFLWIVLALAVLFTMVVNFNLVWIVVMLFSLALFVYNLFFFHKANYKVNEYDSAEDSGMDIKNAHFAAPHFPYASLAVLLVAIIFLISGTFQKGSSIGEKVSAYFNVSQMEARPALSTTLKIDKDVITQKPLLGIGPNRFSQQWLLSKPQFINNDYIFWNTEFTSGIGYIPSTFVTVGLLGFLSWIIFFSAILYFGYRAIVIAKNTTDTATRYISVSSFLGTLYLWTFVVIYNPNIVIITLAFIFTGLFISLLWQEKIIGTFTVSFNEKPKYGFISIMILILLMTCSLVFGYMIIKKFVGGIYLQRGIIAASRENNLDKSIESLNKASQWDKNDFYLRSLSELYLLKLSVIVNQKDVSVDAMRAQFSSVLGQTVLSVNEAVTLDPTNYQNWYDRARIYEALIPLSASGSQDAVTAYNNAKSNYEEAISRNPQNPILYLSLARLEAIKGDNNAARGYAQKALEKKGNYTDAIFFMAQLAINENNLPAAISAVETATTVVTNDPTLFFQLGFLKWSNKDYKGAAASLEQAVRLSDVYSNARYFLGLSYDKLGREQDAIAQFEKIETLNPENQEVKTILSNLRAGKEPFATTPAPTKTVEKKK